MPSPPCKMAAPPATNERDPADAGDSAGLQAACSAIRVNKADCRPSAREKPNGRVPPPRADPARHPVRAADRGVGVGAPDADAARDARAGRRVAGEGDRRPARARGGARAAPPAAAQAPAQAPVALSRRHPQLRSRRRLTCHRRSPCRAPPAVPRTIPEPRVVERPLPETPRTPPVAPDRRRGRRQRRLCHRRSRRRSGARPRSRRGRQRRRSRLRFHHRLRRHPAARPLRRSTGRASSASSCSRRLPASRS